MAFQYASLRAEYIHLAETAAATSEKSAARFHSAAHRILQYKSRYLDVAQRTGIPAVWFMVINERESGSDFRTYLGNGDPFTRVTVHVPKGRGPFKSWEDGAVDATTYDHVGKPGPDGLGWNWPWFLYRCEAWNGFGPRMHGRYTGYLWSGTQVYDVGALGGGKYVADGVWDSSVHDSQLGVFGLARTLIALDPSLDLSAPTPFPVKFEKEWGTPSMAQPGSIFWPVKEEAKLTGVRWLQDSLNKIQGADLVIDGSYGRHTRAAVRQFQATHGLSVDGQAGDLTCAAIDADLAKMPKLIARPKAADTDATSLPAAGILSSVPAASDSMQKPVAKGPQMDFTSLMNLAGMVAPKFAPALAASNPLLPVAINVLGEALGLNGPHSHETVSAGAASTPADVIAAALKKAGEEYAKQVTGAATSVGVTVQAPAAPVPPVVVAPSMTDAPKPSIDISKQTGGLYVSPTVTNVLHVFTWAGGMLLSTGLLDPAGPLSGMAKGSPLLGLVLTVGGPLLNYLVVSASNKATQAAVSK